ncbi:hypothetical protein [Shewanella algae]
MGISKPSQGWAKHQKDMAVLSFISKAIDEINKRQATISIKSGAFQRRVE